MRIPRRYFAFLATFLIVFYTNCSRLAPEGIDLQGTSGGNPISVEIAMAPYAPGSVEHELDMCVSEIRLNNSVNVSTNRFVRVKPDGTSVAQVNFPRGQYASLQLRLSRSCMSPQSLRIVNGQGSFAAIDDVTLSYTGSLNVTGASIQVSLEMQDIVNALETVQQNSQVRTSAESVTENFVSQSSGWSVIGAAGAPSPRVTFGSTWTGSRVFVWGGWDGSNLSNNGALFNPASNQWTPISNTGAPSLRMKFATVWTGSEVIVWGGEGTAPATGGRYNPSTDNWAAIATNPVGSRIYPGFAWSGAQMLVFGGVDLASNSIAGGEVFNFVSNTWASVNTVGMPSARSGAAVHWTGQRFLVWGGRGGAAVSDGALYNPTTDSWTPISTVGAPSARYEMSSVWTGTELIVWGGNDNGGNPLNTGAIYNPTTNTWRAMSNFNAPTARFSADAVWTGKEMLLWSGLVAAASQNGGGRYNLATDTWDAIPLLNSPSNRDMFLPVWTGSSFFVWGGAVTSASFPLGDGAMFTP